MSQHPDFDDSPLTNPLVSIEAEQSALGALLLAPERLGDTGLVAADFAIEAHRMMFESIQRLLRLGQPVDVITVCGDLDERGEAQRVGGLAYLGALVQQTPSAANIRRYAEMVREKSLARQLASIGTDMQALALNVAGESLDERIERVQGMLQALVTQTHADEPVHVADALVAEADAIAWRAQHPGEMTGIATGLDALDETLFGLQPAELVIVAGRPSMGKTALGMQIVEAACAAGKRAHISSLEMSAGPLVRRIASGRAGVPGNAVRKGMMSAEQLRRWQVSASEVASWALTIDPAGGLTVEQICARAKRQQARHGLDLLLVDHLGLIRLPGKANKAIELGDVTSALKTLAKQLNVPVLLLVQLNRESAKAGQHRRPTPTDIRDSGRVEEDADVILLLHRESYYDDRVNPTAAEIIIGKQREGERNQVLDVGWRGQYTRFTQHPDSNWTPEPPKPTYSGYTPEHDL